MAGYEQTIIVGNLGRDPELRYLQSGRAVCSFPVAVTSTWTDRQTNERREKTKWVRVSCWGNLAEITNQYLKKGRQVMVVGTVDVSAYTNNAGEAAASLELTARDVQFLGNRDDNVSSGGQGNRGGQNYDDFAPPPDNVNDIPF